jgi:hypothetical protein
MANDDLHDGTGQLGERTQPVTGWRGWEVEWGGDMQAELASPHIDGHLWADGKLAWDGTCRCAYRAEEWKAPIVEAELDRFEALARDGHRGMDLDMPDYLARIYARNMGASYDLSMLHRAEEAGPPAPPVSPAPNWPDIDLLWAITTARRRLADDLRAHHQFVRHSQELCQCGINAFRTSHLLAERGYLDFDNRERPIHAVGRVELTGRVREYERGYRAERAQIIEVWATGMGRGGYVELICKRLGLTYRGRWS